MLSNKHARLAFLIYALILHFLIFVVLYKYSHTATANLSMADQCHKLFAASGPFVEGQGAHSPGHHVHFDSEQMDHP